MSKEQATVGTKIRYKHGKGLATGEIEAVDGANAKIKTKNGASVTRPLKNLKKMI
jgi:hypothetical protein